MTLGLIQSFPIDTTYEFASSTTSGICPQLCAYIHDLQYECDTEKIVSERGIRLHINELEELSGAIRNVGSGFGIWDSVVDNIQLHNVVTAGENAVINAEPIDTNTTLQITLQSGTIVFDGFSSVSGQALSGGLSYDDISGFTAYSDSVQGGRYQYVNTVTAAEIHPTSGAIIATPAADDVIGKIFMKCTVPFDNNLATLSVGLCGEPAVYVEPFGAPTATGHVRNDVQVYGTKLQKEFDWIAPSEVKPIMVYTAGAPLLSGAMKFNIFYDNAHWIGNFGYVFTGVGPDDPRILARYDMDNDTVSVRRSDFIIPASHFSVDAYNGWMYIAGGTTNSIATSADFVNTIYKADAKNDMVQEISCASMTSPRINMAVAHSTLNMYLAGGVKDPTSISAEVVDVEKLTFSTETVAAAAFNLQLRRSQAAGGQSTTHAYFAGGASWSNISGEVPPPVSGDFLSISIEKLKFSDETVDYTANNFDDGTRFIQSFSRTNGIHWVGGIDESDNTVMTHKYMLFSTESLSTQAEAPVQITPGAAFNNNTKGCLVSGIDGDLDTALNWTNIVQVYNFATDSWSISNGTIKMDSIGDAASIY